MHESTSGSAFFAFQLDKRPQTLTHTKPKSITINGEYFAVSTWKNILMVVYKYLNRVSSEDLLILSDESNVFKTTSRICVGSDPQKLKSPVKIDSTLWIESNFSANNIVDLSAELFTFFGIQLSKVTIEITATANTGENSELAPVSEEISSGNAAFDDALEQWGKDNL
jgi:hypothetical protein